MQTELEDGVIVKEHASPMVVSDEALSFLSKSPISVVDGEKSGNLTPEVKHLKVPLL